MGGSSYDGDVELRSKQSNKIFNYQGSSPNSPQRRENIHPNLSPKKKILNIDCTRATPIVFAMDVTRSRGDDSKIIYSKLPMFIGQIAMKGYVNQPSISFSAIGDATSGDKAPIQVGAFAHDNTLDDILSKFWLEEGGGGTGQESYELTAYFYARHCKFSNPSSDRKGFFFFCGDEGFYPNVSKTQVRDWIGDELRTDISSLEIFEELQKRFHVFFVCPQKPWDERKRDIDAEIKARVETAGGQYENVDIRASLIWNDRNDLDLHIITPSGEEIFYGRKKSSCSGELDVDMNVRGETDKPVENIRWKKGQAKPGHYKVFVQNFRFHEKSKQPIKFRVEVEVSGEIQQFDEIISLNEERGNASNLTIYEFEFAPNKSSRNLSLEDIYINYDDSVVQKQWATVIPIENILVIEDSKAIVDVALGVLCLVEGTRSLDSYISDMKARGQKTIRCQQVQTTLKDLATAWRTKSVAVKESTIKNRGGRSQRF